MSAQEKMKDLIRRMKPGWNTTRGFVDGGEDFVDESIFSFSHDGNFWLVITCGGTFAWKEVSSQWVEIFSNLILQSPRVFVEFDFNHKIINWRVLQDKECPVTNMPPSKPRETVE